jgi:hypothetical protein
MLPKKDYSMPSINVPKQFRAPHATKHDHLDPINPKLGWRRGILLTVVCLIAYVAASQALAWCDRHATVALLALTACLSIILIDIWLRRVPLEHLSQAKYPSSPTRW